MGARRYVYRLVVDKWPTSDGKPFVDQALDCWQAIVDYFHNPHGDDPTPDWMPDLTTYIEDPGDCWTPPNWAHKPPFTRLICEPGEDPEYATGYRGYPDRGVIAVPVAPTRRFLQKSTPAKIVDQLRAWGCVAHVERAELGDWEAI